MKDFLSEDYKLPVKGNYMRWEQGENRFRILDQAIVGYLWWVDKNDKVRQKDQPSQQGDRPVRVRMSAKIPIDAGEVHKHFWAMIVWNYQAQKVQILEITQKGIQSAITALNKNSKWGKPFDYDILVTREGEGFDTEYTITPEPKEPVAKEIQEAFQNTRIDLEALFDNKDPFNSEFEEVTDEDLDKIN